MTYEVNLKEFQGPLDLLLHLIEQAEVDIKDIFISEITPPSTLNTWVR